MKKILALIVITLGMSACSDDNIYVVDNCTIKKEIGSQTITCGTETIGIPDQMPVEAVIDPCGDGLGPDEVLIKLQGPVYIAWYNGLGLSLLNENTDYVTTDAQACKFRIVSGEVVLL